MDVSSLAQSNGSQSSQSSSALSSISEDFDQFLTLLTTQLQYQDPTNPMDSNEMTNQLVQFAGVEQQITQNKNLESMIELLNASSDATAISYIGKDIQVAGNETSFDGAPITFGYTPDAATKATTVRIYNSAGQIVREYAGATSAQRHEIVWDGNNAVGNPVPAGEYQFIVSAKDADNKTVKTTDDVTGRVTGTNFGENGPTLRVGDLEYTLSDVMSVTIPNAA